MELVKNINNGVFILKDVFPKEFIQMGIDIMNQSIKNKSFSIRMQYIDDFEIGRAHV